MKIYKYTLALTDEQVVEMPGPLNLLSVQMQKGALCLWAVVCDGAPLEKVEIKVVGTGNPFDDYLDWSKHYVGTVQDGRFVWHVFAKDPNEKK